MSDTTPAMRSAADKQTALPGMGLEDDREALWQAWQSMPRHSRLDFEQALAFPPLRRGLARQAAAGRAIRRTR